MNILICNVGSTSLKYQLFDMDRDAHVLAAGGAERVGAERSRFYHKNPDTGDSVQMDASFPTHREAIAAMLDHLVGGCIETLEEINGEIREAYEHAGGKDFTYVPCLNDDDAHIAVLTEVIAENMAGWA